MSSEDVAVLESETMLKEILLTAPSPEGAISICVEVIYSDRRTLGLEVTAEGRVRARVPRRAGDRAVKEFVEKKKDWILEKYLLQKKRREERQEAACQKHRIDGETCFFWETQNSLYTLTVCGREALFQKPIRKEM